LKAGLSFANYSKVVSLIPSSLSDTTSVALPSLSKILTLIGKISSLNNPAF